MSTGQKGSQYQVVVGAEGSPEFSSECIPDVNRVLPAAAGHTERNKDGCMLTPASDRQKGAKCPALSTSVRRTHLAPPPSLPVALLETGCVGGVRRWEPR